jgi:hypothetical protein
MPESLEIELETLPVRPEPEPRGELRRVGRWELAVAEIGCKLNHRLRPQPTVEVVVQKRLRCLADRLKLQHCLPTILLVRRRDTGLATVTS